MQLAHLPLLLGTSPQGRHVASREMAGITAEKSVVGDIDWKKCEEEKSVTSDIDQKCEEEKSVTGDIDQ